MNKYILFATVIFIFTILVFTDKTFAAGQYGCTGQYGSSCESVQVLIDKKVKNPVTGVFVDQLTINDEKFNPGDTITFQLKVRNNGNTVLNNLTVNDSLPSYLDYISSNNGGKFDANTKKVSFNISEIKSGQEVVLEIVTKAYPENRLPSDKGILCIVNNSEVQLNGLSSSDNAQLCIAQKVLPAQSKGGLTVHPVTPITTTPSTGPGLISLISLAGSLAAGVYIRRK